MQLTHSIALDFGRDTLPITIFAKQYDKESRFVEIVPLECGKDYTLESGVTARLQLTKPDGHTVLKTATIANGVIKVELTEQTLAVAGTAVAEIGLYKGNSLLSSQIFYIEIKRAAYNPDAPASSDEYPALIDALGKVETSVGSANSAAAAANAAATKAETAAGGADTAAQNATSAASAANSAASGANTAKTNANSAASAANTAAGAANSAAAAANEAAEAAEGAENVNISATQTTTGADITVTNREGEQTTVHIDTLTAVNTWEDIKNAVRLGLGEKLFPVGYEFATLDADTTQNIIWVVRAHDHHTAANNKLTHTMTLETKNVYSLSSGAQKAVQYDATEAFYFAELGLAAGTYNITIANQAWHTADNGKTFQFELTKALPVGGQLVFAMTYNATLEGKSVKSYANKTTTTALETVTLTEGSEGTSLGTTNGSSPNVNHMHRAIFGSNNYAQSAVRQWLNSAAVAGSVWTPTNVFDRPASWATSYNGFMHGLPADFLAVVQPAVLACRTNSLFEVESLDGTAFAINQLYSLKADKFFLLSRPEIFGNWDSESYKDGTQLEYYNGLTATERIKRDAAGTARYAWLRSPTPSTANFARVVLSSGGVGDVTAYYGNGVAPACIIA